MNNAGGFVEQITNIVKDTLYPILKNYPRIVSARVISIQDRLAVVRMPYAEDDSNDFNAYVVTSQLVSAGDVVNVAYWASLSTAVVLSNTSTLAAAGGGESGNYNNLENKPSINSVTLTGNKMPADFGLYGTNNAPPYPVRSVNTKTGDVVLTANDMPGGGESLADVRKRVRAAFDEYVAKYPDKTILVAAHDAVNKAIICDVLGLGMEHFWQIKQDNTCINVLECNEGVWRAVLLNATNHMGFLFSGIEQAGL